MDSNYKWHYSNNMVVRNREKQIIKFSKNIFISKPSHNPHQPRPPRLPPLRLIQNFPPMNQPRFQQQPQQQFPRQMPPNMNIQQQQSQNIFHPHTNTPNHENQANFFVFENQFPPQTSWSIDREQQRKQQIMEMRQERINLESRLQG